MPRHLNSFWAAALADTDPASGDPSWWELTSTRVEDHFGNRPDTLWSGSLVNGPSGTNNAYSMSAYTTGRGQGGIFRQEDFDEDWTISFWFNYNVLHGSNNGPLLSRYAHADKKELYVYTRPDGSLETLLYDSSTGNSEQICTSTPGTIVTGTWYMYTLTYKQSSKTYTVYLDDAVNKTGTFTYTVTPTSLVAQFNAVHVSPSVSNFGSNARYSKIYFNKKAISSSTVDELYNSGDGWTPPGSLVQYVWDGTIGGTVNNIGAGNPTFAMLRGGPSYNSTDFYGNRTITYVGGPSEKDRAPDGSENNQAWSYGDGKYWIAPEIDITNDFTLAWFAETAGDNDCIISNGADFAAGCLTIVYNQPNPDNYQTYWHNGTALASQTTSTVLATGAKNHYCLTYDATSQVMTMYVNGVQDWTRASVVNTVATTGDLYMGRRHDAGFHFSSGAAAYLYINEGIALTQAEAAILYGGGGYRNIYWDSLD